MNKIISAFKAFFDEVRVETERTSWPTRDITIGSTIAVIIFSFLVAFLVGILDFIIARIVGVFLR
ncbi:MAG: preprotein translocase subunit SecE [candidate division WOR-3 bacterium]|uniref:Protein translocase subunit SecE n=1 Tax=candidate division WOR-3 bacterium TaxID=2052148 RepID=A0A7V4ECF1_UNCW3